MNPQPRQLKSLGHPQPQRLTVVEAAAGQVVQEGVEAV
jgi:hypothetical protein